MSHPSTKQYSYTTQLGFLVLFLCVGFLLGYIATLILLFQNVTSAALQKTSLQQLIPSLIEHASLSQMIWIQLFSTLFMFFLPVVFYALVCHKKPFTHLGFAHKIGLQEVLVVIAIMIAALPLVDVLSQLTLKLPFSKATLQHFQDMEDKYDKEVSIFTQMKTVGDYILSLVVIAFLPAVFEETIFRGGFQNLLSRWTKNPILAITLTAILFSAVHLSYIGFLSRFVLGFILGWIYYRTGNIWLNILGHFTNNAVAVTGIYMASKDTTKAITADGDIHFPMWIGLASIAAVYLLLVAFEKICKKDIDHPGEEVSMPGYNYFDPFASANEHSGNLN